MSFAVSAGDEMQPDSAASTKDSRGQAAAVAESTTATGMDLPIFC